MTLPNTIWPIQTKKILNVPIVGKRVKVFKRRLKEYLGTNLLEDKVHSRIKEDEY